MLSTTLKNTVNLQTITANHRYVVQSLSAVHRAESVHAAVRSGLASRPKTLPPILFYDERGSRLFEEISELPEYYLTRTEQAILDRYAPEMVTFCAPELLLVELGSGSSAKTRTLLDALFAGRHQPTYRPVDISESMLHATAEELVGPDKVVANFPLIAGSEDFAYFLQQRPGCFVRMGNGAGQPLLHNAGYDFNDENLTVGAAYWARLVERYLEN